MKGLNITVSLDKLKNPTDKAIRNREKLSSEEQKLVDNLIRHEVKDVSERSIAGGSTML